MADGTAAPPRMHDVLVVGGGPVGTLLAASLTDRGLDVSVWEARVDEPGHSRAIGVHPPSLDLVDRLGLADDLLAEAVRIRRGVARSGGRVLGELGFDGVHPRWPFVAAVPQHRTEALLRRGLHDRRPEALRLGVRFESLAHRDDHVEVSGTGPEGPVRASARFVVGADGARSAVRTALGLDEGGVVRELPDRYVMGDFADQTGQGPDAVVHLERDGVVESFPLPGGVRRFVAYLPAGRASSGAQAGARAVAQAVPGAQSGPEARAGSRPVPHAPGPPDPVEVAALVTRRTGLLVDPATSTMTSAFGVRRRLAGRTVSGRVVLIGDAAHEISPIGGQGMNLGWSDAAALEPVLTAALSRAGGRRLDPSGLRRYEAGRAASAARAARQAEWNTALGRPVSGAGAVARDVALRVLLGAPTSALLARVYTMRWI